MPFSIEILTLFPEFFASPLRCSILGRAVDGGHASIAATDIRDFATDKHRTADDLPYGGGAGMVMKVEPVVAALEDARARLPSATRVYLSAQGKPLTQAYAAELATREGLILLCGHYEGVDERAIEGWIDEEVSVGDYVLTGGEPAALVLIDAVVRLLPGVVGNPESLADESFSGSGIEYPHYTRPREFRGREVPEVLLSGHHARIDEWRAQQALERTRSRRPDLLDEEDS